MFAFLSRDSFAPVELIIFFVFATCGLDFPHLLSLRSTTRLVADPDSTFNSLRIRGEDFAGKPEVIAENPDVITQALYNLRKASKQLASKTDSKAVSFFFLLFCLVFSLFTNYTNMLK